MIDKFKEIMEDEGPFFPRNIDTAVDKCATLLDQYALEFAEWKDENSYPAPFSEKGFYLYDDTTYPGILSLPELLQLFKKQCDEK